MLEALEEHHVVKWLCSELEGMEPADERFDAKVTVLIENVRHHVKEEETEFFPHVRDSLGRKNLAEVGELLAEAKKAVPTHPHPKAPDEPPFNAIAGLVAGLVDRARDAASSVVDDARRTGRAAVKRNAGPVKRTASKGPAAKRTAAKKRATTRG